MDTIPGKNNSSHGLSAGAIVGILGSVVMVVICAATLLKVDSLAKRVEALSTIETDNRNAAALANKASKDIESLHRATQSAFDAIGPEIGRMKASIAKLEKAAKASAVAQMSGIGEAAAVAGPDEYVVGPGDTGAKIADATGTALADLVAANPGLDWRHLKVGQKIKLLSNPPAAEVPDKQSAPSSQK